MEPLDVTEKIKRAEIRELSFVPEGETRKIAYKRLFLIVESNGEEFELTLDVGKDKIQILQLADAV